MVGLNNFNIISIYFPRLVTWYVETLLVAKGSIYSGTRCWFLWDLYWRAEKLDSQDNSRKRREDTKKPEKG